MQQSPFLQLVRKRRSIRAFKSTKVDEKVVREILQACDLAPSSGGLQTYEIYRIDNADKKKALVSAAMDQAFIAEAPLVLVFCANASRSVHKYGERSSLFSVQDATIAAAYAQLAAYDLGLTTVWVGAFNEKRVSDVLGLPQEHRPVAILPIGNPNEKPKDKTTRGIDDLLHMIK